ncbi:MAG: dTDP-glucose 4,6-dehydratase, partial [Candidatus Paceibacteria bacterium]
MTLLVTGGAGFMGSYFIKYVLKQKADWNVINVDKLTYSGDTTKLKDIEDDYRYQFVEEDITNGEQMEHLVSYYGVDGIINFAAETHVDNSIDHADPFITTNITGTHTLLEVARKYGTRIVQVSTDEVYGSIQEGRVTEDAPFAPNSPYAASKASADLLCRAYYQTYGVDFVGSHACNVLGPYQ